MGIRHEEDYRSRFLKTGIKNIHIMHTTGQQTTTLAFAGTLGDAFIVLCKLYGLHKKTGKKFRLIRHSLHPGMDRLIRALFDSVPFIEYLIPCNAFGSLEDLYASLRKSPYPVIGTRWEGIETGTYEVDYADIDPFPVIETPEVEVKTIRPNIGVQLHCGSEGTNFRGFSLKWFNKLRKYLQEDRFNIYLFGTGAVCYKEKEMNSVCDACALINMTGKTNFINFMSYIKKMDCFISFEGFSALFAMSQKVKTLLYNQYPYGIKGTVHPLWYKNNLIIQLNKNIISRKLRDIVLRHRIYSPGIPQDFIGGINRKN